MFCTGCGKELVDDDKFCSRCGRSTGPSPAPRRLTRAMSEKMIGGVCAGLARYVSIDPTIMRLIWIAVTCFTGAGLVAYPIAWIVVPRDDSIRPAPVAAQHV